jgi:hypothetical protein
MDLVVIPPPRVGEYAMDVNIERRGASLRFELTIRDRATGEPVRDLETIHERLLHLFVISRSLETFVHVHPESRKNGAYVLDQVLKPGEYVLLVDFLPSSGTPQMLHRAFVTPGYAGPLFAAAPTLEPTGADVVADGVRVTFEGPQPNALRRSAMRFRLADARTGAAITDLEPYLGAPAHLLIVNPQLTDALHAHPEGEPSRGPELSFDPLFPEPGCYKMWLQIQRGGRVITLPFVIEVAPR